MANNGLFIAGGALAGIGQGLVEEGKQRRQLMLEQLRHSNEMARDEARDSRLATRLEQQDQRRADREDARDDRRAEREGGLLSSVQQTEDGQIVGITRSGRVVELGIKGKAKPEDLVEVGDPDSPTGSRYVPKSQAAGQPGKFSNDALDTYHNRQKTEWEDARRQAEAEASDKAGWLSTDETDFADDGGSRSAFIERRTNEILRDRRGGGKTKEGRPIVPNADGSVSTERSITVTDERINGGRPTNIPTMFGGKQVSDEEAIERIVRAGGKDPETGRTLPGFNSIEEAVAAAKKRSEDLGAQYGGRQKAGAPSGTGSRNDPSHAILLEQARDAIRRGAPRDKVIERLRQLGVDPSGL